jgi:RNA polymerase sigma factor for flagellar operon FliA
MNRAAEYAAVRELSDAELVERYARLVKRIAYHLAARLPDSVDVNDLIQTGMLGLLEAARRFSGKRGANFETYAGIRIRGAMLDELRRTDWTPRSVHRRAREVLEAVHRVESRTGRSAEPAEIAGELDISVDEYFDAVRDAATCHMFSVEDLARPKSGGEGVDAPDEDTPERELTEHSVRRAITEAIDALPEREKLVMSLYYDEELNLKEIGQVLGVSESRVCQLHGQALVRVRSRLGEPRP